MEFGDPRLSERFWNKVKIDPESGCWLWQGAVKRKADTTRAYGSFTYKGKPTLISQVLCDVLFPGYDTTLYRPAYHCNNYSCAHPEHVYLRPRSTCKRNHENPPRDKARNCLTCKKINADKRPTTTKGRSSRRQPTRRLNSVEKPIEQISTNEIWRPTGWPKEVLNGRLKDVC